MDKNGYLVISLDFELLWGVFDVLDDKKKKNYFENTRKVIPEILELFRRNEIHATWATVGMLFNSDWKEWEENFPEVFPEYANMDLSAFEFGKKIAAKESEFCCFAPGIIRDIKETPFQEIGSHTYSHFYCLEKGQNVEAFRADLKRAVQTAKRFQIEMKSLVFPRNQYNRDYLKVCKEFGIKNVRTNPETWYWDNPEENGLLNKLGRTGDAYNVFGSPKSYLFSDLKKENNLPLEQRASRFFRPVEKNLFLRRLKMGRIFSEMRHAAKKNEIYHIWWHPHNFGISPEKSLNDLKLIIDYYKECNRKFDFKSASMGEISDLAELE